MRSKAQSPAARQPSATSKTPSPVELQLLMLVQTELSGREAAKRYEAEYGKRISYGTLYTTFRRLREIGLVEMREGCDEDGRVRYFLLSASGGLAVERAIRHYSALAASARRLWGRIA